MLIRKTAITDVDRIVEIYDAARRYMHASGNLHQWRPDYPSAETVATDMARGGSYVVEADGRVVATFCHLRGPDPTYATIYDGQWLDDEPYGVIHRAASDGSVRGVMRVILDYCRKLTPTLRIDTHRDNLTMQHAVSSYGFIYCGIIHLANGDERLAYQLKRI